MEPPFIVPEDLINAVNQNTGSLERLADLMSIEQHRRGVKEQADADFRENVLGWLQKLHQQGQP